MENPNARAGMSASASIEVLKKLTTDEFQVFTSSEFDDALQTALDALNKQVAKRPILYTPVPGGSWEIKRCPCCGSENLIHGYPCKCGQRIYWR